MFLLVVLSKFSLYTSEFLWNFNLPGYDSFTDNSQNIFYIINSFFNNIKNSCPTQWYYCRDKSRNSKLYIKTPAVPPGLMWKHIHSRILTYAHFYNGGISPAHLLLYFKCSACPQKPIHPKSVYRIPPSTALCETDYRNYLLFLIGLQPLYHVKI